MALKVILLPIFLVWFVALLLSFTRREISVVCKISSLTIFIFYTMWFWPELIYFWNAYSKNFIREISQLFKYSMQILPVLLIFAWPCALLLSYNSRTISGCERALRSLVLLTLFYWLFIFASGLGLIKFPSGSNTFHQIVKKISKFKLPRPP